MGDISGTMRGELRREPWNKGKIVGQKAPLKLKDIWALRVRLRMENRVRELALFNLGIDSKLRGCHLVKLKVRDVCHGDQIAHRAIVMQQKTQRPVQFEITELTRETLGAWINQAGLRSDDFLFTAASTTRPISEPASTRGSWRAGLASWGWIAQLTERTQYAAPRRR